MEPLNYQWIRMNGGTNMSFKYKSSTIQSRYKMKCMCGATIITEEDALNWYCIGCDTVIRSFAQQAKEEVEQALILEGASHEYNE